MTEQDLDYVRQMYESGDDPWRISTGRYERRKRELLLASLPEDRYQRAFEPACASGALTGLLQPRCDILLAADVAERAVELTRLRVPDAEVVQLQVPQDWPGGQFDLIVLSEFGYYLPTADWAQLVTRVAESLAQSWTVVACHWRHPFAERLISTDELHAELAAALPGRLVTTIEDEDFRLEVWANSGSSLAERDDR